MFERKNTTATKQQEPDLARITPEELATKLHGAGSLPSVAEMRAHLATVSHANHTEWLNLINNPERRVFEILTKEYVDALAGYLSQRARELGGTPDRPITVLEVGAGNGRLAHFLNESLSRKPESCATVVATDSGEWGIKPDFPVERTEHKQAIAKHQPSIVIFSWMPADTDCTSDFRQAECVKEYLLIGEKDESTCGEPWETWGVGAVPAPGTDGVRWTPPYEVDGFVRRDLNELSELQLSRLSVGYFPSGERSATVSFVRSGVTGGS